jgi:putative alpha-1,2-mannosidase
LLGIRNFDLKLAYKAMKQSATQQQQYAGRTGLDQYIKLGYVPYEISKQGAVLTQSYSCTLIIFQFQCQNSIKI